MASVSGILSDIVSFITNAYCIGNMKAAFSKYSFCTPEDEGLSTETLLN